MVLFIKNMVCDRCKMAVRNELEKAGLLPLSVSLGEVVLDTDALTDTQTKALDKSLRQLGFELIDNKRTRMIEKIKSIIIGLVHYPAATQKEKLSNIISQELHYDYPYLSNLFSETEGITIEYYMIMQKIEKIKEHIVYDEQTLSEIADHMGYSSVAHLSSQFKKYTGLTPTHFKQLRIRERNSLHEVGKPVINKSYK